MKKLTISLIVITMLAGVTTGCVKKDEKVSVNNEQKKLSISIFDRGLVPHEEGTYENNRWTKWVNENSGIEVKWVPVPRSDVKSALNVMFASKSAPDLIVEYDRSYFQELADQRLIQPIGEYIDKYSTKYKEYASKHSEFIPYTNINGKPYLVTSERATTANHAIWIRQDWLDKLQLKKPETIDELFNVAKAFATEDPDGNKVKDTLGVAFRTGVFEATFMVDRQWYADENGKVYNSQLTDRFMDMLAFKKKMFDEGIIDKEYATDTNFQRQIQAWVTGKAGIYFAQYTADDSRDLLKNVPSAVLAPLESVSTKYGKNGLHQEPPAGLYVGFNSSMRNPKVAVEFLDWMIEKGYPTLTYGIEGVHYKLEDGVQKPINVDKNNIELKYASSEMPILRQGKTSPERILKLASLNSDLDKKIAALNAESLSVALKNAHRQDIPFGIVPNVQRIKQFMTEWTPIAEEIKTQVILGRSGNGTMTPEMGIEKLRSEWARLGGKEIEKEMQTWYDQNKSNFSKRIQQ